MEFKIEISQWKRKGEKQKKNRKRKRTQKIKQLEMKLKLEIKEFQIGFNAGKSKKIKFGGRRIKVNNKFNEKYRTVCLNC